MNSPISFTNNILFDLLRLATMGWKCYYESSLREDQDLGKLFRFRMQSRFSLDCQSGSLSTSQQFLSGCRTVPGVSLVEGADY